jgi:hypothetical protein
MLYELKGSSVVCPCENVSLPQKLVPNCLSSFPNDEEYKWKHPQASKVFKKGGPLGMNQLRWFNFKGQT